MTLSGPPLRSASSMSRSAAAETSGISSASAMVSWLTGSDSPSEQSRYLSPACASRMMRVGSTGAPVSARMMSERCGWLCACSGVMRPSSTSVWTKVSSLEICVSSPSRIR
ncbi:Uncharacterised protein [Mycobacteroides abscessus subsp. abscessus]|nr:Uncharacterised protein [Mycobacteroides abscessus subsp. abscessus]